MHTRSRRPLAQLCAAGVLMLHASSVRADIRVGAMHHYIEPEQRTLQKEVLNTGTSTAYVRVDVASVDEGGHVLPMPSGDASDSGLLVSPARLIIPAGGRHTVRVLLTGPRDVEKYYRVRFVPVPPTKAHGFDVSAADSDAFNASVTTAIKVMIGYGVFVIGAPVHARFDTDIHGAGRETYIRNGGNTSLLVHDQRICERADDRCRALSFVRVAPGATIALPMEPSQYRRLVLQEGADRRSIIIGK